MRCTRKDRIPTGKVICNQLQQMSKALTVTTGVHWTADETLRYALNEFFHIIGEDMIATAGQPLPTPKVRVRLKADPGKLLVMRAAR